MKKNQFIRTIYAGEGKVLHRIEDRPFIDKSRSEVYRNPVKYRIDVSTFMGSLTEEEKSRLTNSKPFTV